MVKKDIGKVNFAAIIIEAGNSIKNKTGLWRTLRPVVNKEKCKGYGQCIIFCPEGTIKCKNGKAEINYDYCKGCGICARVCPVKAIYMIKEEK